MRPCMCWTLCQILQYIIFATIPQAVMGRAAIWTRVFFVANSKILLYQNFSFKKTFILGLEVHMKARYTGKLT